MGSAVHVRVQIWPKLSHSMQSSLSFKITSQFIADETWRSFPHHQPNCFNVSVSILPSFAPNYYNFLLHPIHPWVHLNIISSILSMNLLRQLGLFLYMMTCSTEYSFDMNRCSVGILHYFSFQVFGSFWHMMNNEIIQGPSHSLQEHYL